MEIKVTESEGNEANAGNVKTSAHVVEANDDTGVTTTQVSQKGGYLFSLCFGLEINIFLKKKKKAR